MHNLLLGTAKLDNGLLSSSDLHKIEKSEQISFPYGTGRIPLKIGSSFAGFTAHQWRLWVTVLSPLAIT